MVTCPKCSHKFDPPRITTYSEDFLTFWKAYGATTKTPAASKSDAFKAWNQIAPYRPPLNHLLYAVKGYHQSILKSNGITCHPSTWLRQGRYESFLPTDTTSGTTSGPAEEVSTSSSVEVTSVPLVHSSWGEFGKSISSEIGAAKFTQWFTDAVLEPEAPGPRIITVGTSFRRDWIEQKFSYALFKTLGAFEIVVRKP